MSREWPLIGRAAELDRIDESLRSRSSGIVLAGPAGVGKTRLAVECLSRASSAGYVPARVTATRAARELPFGAFAPLLPALDARLSPSGATETLARAAHAIAEGPRRVAVLVDDAHLLDDASATLAHQLAAGYGALVIATVRSGEVAPDPIVALWKDGLAERVEVGPLKATDIATLLAAVLGGPLDGVSLSYLASRSQGNVLYLRELVLAATDGGALTDEGGVWHLVGPIAASSRLTELVEARLGRLSPIERRVLEMAAYGEPVGVHTLERLAGSSCLQLLEDRGLLSVTRTRRRMDARLVHPLHGDVIRASAGALRASEIRRDLADDVEMAGTRRREDLLRVASWRADSGGHLAPDVMLGAARQAANSGDLDLAERLARAASDSGAGVEAGLLLAQVTGLSGRWADAEHQLVALASDAADDTERKLIALTRIDNLAYGRGRRDEAIQVAEDAEAAIVDGRAEIAARRANLLLFSGRTAEALALAEPIMAAENGVALVWACLVTATGLALAGRLEAALSAADKGTAAHADVTGRPLIWELHALRLTRIQAMVYGGRLREAGAAAQGAYDEAVAAGEHQAGLAWVRARVCLVEGRVVSAARLAREAANLNRRLGHPRFLRWCLADLAHALALGGKHDQAAAALAEHDSISAEPDAPYRANALQARAWLAVAEGRVAAGCDLLEDAARAAAATGARVNESAALHDLARLGAARRVAGRLGELATEIEGDLATTRADHAAALATADSAGLERVSDSFEAMGALLLGAEAAVGAAVALRRAGEARQAAALERKAATLARSCEGAMTPALADVETQALLSARELEVAGLAAAGLSNREIADRLFLSVRTVESQLQRAYEKLGIRKRSDLPDALGPR